MYKEELVLNNLQWLICHKTQPNQIIYIWYVCIKRIWHWITYNGWYTIKLNQTLLWWFMRWEVNGRVPVVLYSFNVTFSRSVSLEFKWCNLSVILTLLLLVRISILFHQRFQISRWSIAVHVLGMRMLMYISVDEVYVVLLSKLFPV